MMKRPILHAAIAFGTGILTAWYIRQVFFIMVIFLLILLLYCYGIIKKLQLFKNVLFWGICLVCGYFNYALQYTLLLQPVEPFFEATVTVYGYVDGDCARNDDRSTFDFFAEEVHTQNEQKTLNRKVRINVYNSLEFHDFSPGTHLAISGNLEKPARSRNPGGFDYESYLFSKKLPGVMSVNSDAVNWNGTVKNLPLLRIGLSLRDRILSSLERNLSHEKAALMAAMLTGYKENLTETMEEAFSAAGLSHIMAVSGANLVFLLLPLLWLFKKLGLNRRVAAIAGIPFMFLYILITGMEASVLRASLMAFVMIAGKALDKNADLMNSLGIASLALLVVNPFMLFDAGFLLSFGATFGLGLLYKRIQAFISEKVPGFIRETLAATMAAQAGVLPILILYFSKISVISLFSNLIVVPLTGITTVVGMISVLADCIHNLLGIYSSYMLEGLLHIILYITETCAAIPWAEVNMQHWSIFGILLYYIFLILLGTYGLHFFIRHKSRIAVFVFLAGVILVVQGVLPGRLKVIFTDVGQGDSILIQTAEGKNYMLDGGGGFNEAETGYIGRRILLPLLMHEGVSKLDQVIVSHAHIDHLSGLLTLLECFPVASVGLPDYPGAAGDFAAIIEICNRKNIEMNYYASGDKLHLDSKTTMNILYPVRETPVAEDELNNTSLCALLCYNRLEILFTGDLEVEAEMVFFEQNEPFDCDLLKVAHHGGKNATSDRFLAYTQPDTAVISVGKNSYGHPSAEVLERLLLNEVTVFTTYLHGAVIVDSNGLNYRIRTWYRDDRFTFLN